MLQRLDYDTFTSETSEGQTLWLKKGGSIKDFREISEVELVESQ